MARSGPRFGLWIGGKVNWFRWHHGTSTDPKWRVIAMKSGAPLSLVLAVWTTLTENASANLPNRGTLEGWEADEQACALDANADIVRAVFDAMQGRVLDGNRLTGWKKRQPAREDGSAERAKAWRENRKTGTQTNAGERKRTPEEKRVFNTPIVPKGTKRTQISYPQDFITFWSAYPRAVGKGAAFKAWQQIDPTPDMLAEILAAIASQKKMPQWTRDGGDFIPHPATWLRQRRWEDETRKPEARDISVHSYL